jgi:hypothetical protein
MRLPTTAARNKPAVAVCCSAVAALMLSRQIDIAEQEPRRPSFCKQDLPPWSFDLGALLSGPRRDGPAISVKSGRVIKPSDAGGWAVTSDVGAGTTIAITRGAGVTIEAQAPNAMKTEEIASRK